MSDFSVHDQPDFARVYDEDDDVTVRRGDLRAILDVATQSMDFGSGFLDNEQVEVLRGIAVLLGLDPVVATPFNFRELYGYNQAEVERRERRNARRRELRAARARES